MRKGFIISFLVITLTIIVIIGLSRVYLSNKNTTNQKENINMDVLIINLILSLRQLL